MNHQKSPREIEAEAKLLDLSNTVCAIQASIRLAANANNSQAGSGILLKIWDTREQSQKLRNEAIMDPGISPGVNQLEKDLNAAHQEALKLVAEHVEESKTFMENRRARYEDAGEWARHYSTVRMTVATFALTTCVAIIALKGDKPTSAEEKVYIANSVGVLWLLGVWIFYVFSYYSYKQSNRQKKYRLDLPVSKTETDNAAPVKPAPMTGDLSWWVVTILTAGYGCFAVTKASAYISDGLKMVIFVTTLAALCLPACMDDWIKGAVWKDKSTGAKDPFLDRVSRWLEQIGRAL